MDVVIDTLPAVRKDYLILFHKDNTITNPLAELIQGILNSADGFVINEIHILKNG